MYTHRPLPEEPSRWVHVDCRDRLAVLEPGIPDLVLGSAEGKWECALHGPGLWKTLAQQELQIQLEAAIVKVYHLIRLEWQRSGDWNFPMLTRATFETLAQNVAPSTRYSVYNVGPDGKVSEPTDEPALRSAARSGRAEIVSLLLENHADVHAKDDQALLLAAENGHVETVKVLLEHGADYHAKNDRALQSAASHGHIDVISLFLDRIDNVSAVCTAALPWAAQGGSTETVDFLLSRGADVHAKTRDLGEAALNLCCRQRTYGNRKAALGARRGYPCPR